MICSCLDCGEDATRTVSAGSPLNPQAVPVCEPHYEVFLRGGEEALSLPEPVLTPEQVASLTNATRQAMETAAVLRSTFEKVGRAILHAGEKIDAYLWEPYRQAGCPFGTNYRGRDRWYVEEGELDRARTAIGELQEWSDALANARRLAAEKGIPVDG